jgi:hypothetical protein
MTEAAGYEARLWIIIAAREVELTMTVAGREIELAVVIVVCKIELGSSRKVPESGFLASASFAYSHTAMDLTTRQLILLELTKVFLGDVIIGLSLIGDKLIIGE